MIPLPRTHTGCRRESSMVTATDRSRQPRTKHVFKHLATVGLISGSAASYAAGTFPSHPFGGTYYILYATLNGKASNWITYTLVPADVALAMDTSLDDGVDTTGSIRASAVYGGTAPLTVYVDL